MYKDYIDVNNIVIKILPCCHPISTLVGNKCNGTLSLTQNQNQVVSMSEKKGIVFQFGDKNFPSAKITDWSYYLDFYNKKMRGEFSISLFSKNKKKHCRDTTFILEAIKIINKP
jgi:hypothetical protein